MTPTPASSPPRCVAALARFAIRRYDGALALRGRIESRAASDPALETWRSVAEGQLCDAERSLALALCCWGDPPAVVSAGELLRTHLPARGAWLGGRLYLAVPDPNAGVAPGGRGPGPHPVMQLAVVEGSRLVDLEIGGASR